MPKNFPRLFHIFFGLLDLTALVAAFFYSLNVLDIYFSYFTVLSNILITIIFLSIGFFVTNKMPKFLNNLYGPATLYMCITGVIFWTVLRNNHALATIPWINLVLHGITPIAAVIGWFIYPAQKKIKLEETFLWLLPPLCFVFYTLIRGPFAHWYPYPFLNPAAAGGYEGVARWTVGILTGTWIVSLLLIWRSNSNQKL